MANDKRLSLVVLFAWSGCLVTLATTGAATTAALPLSSGADPLAEAPTATPGVEYCQFESPLPYDNCQPCACSQQRGWFDELTLFAGIDGSKQPQDFGVNANLGVQVNFNWGAPLSEHYGIGFQFGSTLVTTDNAVQVYQLLGEKRSRLQNYYTLGLFQRTESGFAWGVVYDLLDEDSFDDFVLSQWRFRASCDVGPRDQFGVTLNISERDDQGVFDAPPTPTTVRLRPIDQGSLFWRHWWQSGVQTTSWLGVASEHGENNAVTGFVRGKEESFLLGADILAPLNNYLAIYGETNLIMPADTGTVDAFMGLQFFPGGGAKQARRGRFAPLLPVAAPTSFSTDLLQ